MNLSPKHLLRYKAIGRLLWKYGRLDFRKEMGLEEEDTNKEEDSGDKSLPDQLADDLEAMGPTYVKLGQILSGRPDLLPDAYLKALARLQDKVKPFEFSKVEEAVTKELGVRLSKVFSHFDPEPLAAASLGQVHSAALRDGRAVVVKVQRPDIAQQIAEDFEVLAEIATFLDAHTEVGHRHRFAAIVEEFRISVRNELNYELEARNLTALAENLKEFERIRVPLPIPDYSSHTVLTMEAVQGRKITAIGPLAQLEMDGKPLAEELFKAYLKQVLMDGLFHADPHPGNVFLMDNGDIALLDLGMVGHTSPGMQDNLLKLLLAISDGNSEDAGDIVIRMSQRTGEFDPVEFQLQVGRLIASRQNQGLQDLNVGKAILEVTRHAADNGLHVPSELTLLGKTLLQLDEVGQILDPEFDPAASIRRNVADLMTQRMLKQATQGSLFSAALEMKDFVGALPNRLNRVMDAVTNNELEVKIKAVDAKDVMEGFQKIANRITTGLILASLILGACLLMRVETAFQLFGYPGLAILCFLGAAAGGIWLVVNITLQDKKTQRRPRR